MSNRLFQGIIYQMKDAVDRIIGVVDETGVVISCSDLGRIGELRQEVREEITYAPDVLVSNGYTYRPVSASAKSEYAVFVEGEDKEAVSLSMVLAISLSNIKSLYDDKHDKRFFIKNIILDNILPSDIYSKSKELHFVGNIPRVVVLFKFPQKSDVVPYDIIQNIYTGKSRDYIISVGENDCVLVMEVKPSYEMLDIEKITKELSNAILNEYSIKVVVGIGTIVENLKDLARSYKEAQIALEIGRVFDTENSIICYDNLGIGRLIYQLPTTLCEMFLQEVFKKGPLESLDKETLMTIQAFFENNLNVSETSRKLFVHRNTLVYRLEKIRKLTGLDLREFEHAITFKVALMVKKYLSSKQLKY